MFKRTISALLALLTVFSILPMAVFAAEDELVMEEASTATTAGMVSYEPNYYYEYELNESESNNTRGTADQIYYDNTIVTGVISKDVNDTDDYYVFSVGQTVYLSIFGISGNPNERTTKFRLYNSNGTCLKTSSFQYLVDSDSGYSNDQYDEIYLLEYSIPAGTYYIRVTDTSTRWIPSYSFLFQIANQLDRPVITVSNNSTTGKPVIKWKSVANAEKYQVYRSKDNKNWSRMTTTTSTTYTNKNAEPGVKYYYKVKAITSSTAYVDSRYSEVKSRVCDCAKPEISVSRKASTGKNVIKWDEIDGAEKYEVWYATSKGGTYSKLGTASGTSLTHKKGVAGKVYYYKVKAISEDTSSANSAFSSMKYSTCDLPRPVVTISRNSSGSPKLTWEKISGAESYKIYRSTDGEDWTLMKTTTGTSYTNSNAVEGVKYYYKVMAIHAKSAANSAYSTVKSITAK